MLRSGHRAGGKELEENGLRVVHYIRKGRSPGGIPVDARVRIEEMFSKVMRGEAEPRELKDELHRWDLFEEYEDRFLALFQKGRRG